MYTTWCKLRAKIHLGKQCLCTVRWCKLRAKIHLGKQCLCTVRSSRHSKRGPESIFYIQSEDILTKRGRQNFSPRFVTRSTLSSLFHNMGLGGYGRYPLFVRARHVQRCVKKCPHFECVIHRFVLALNAGANTLYTRVYIVSSL